MPPKVPPALSPAERQRTMQRAAELLKAKGAVLVAHYYVDGDLQDLAEETGGCVSDSLEMARFGRDHAAQTLVVAGVRFMGESAKILKIADKTSNLRAIQAESVAAALLHGVPHLAGKHVLLSGAMQPA